MTRVAPGAAGRKHGGELRPVLPAAALHLDELGGDRAARAGDMAGDGLALGLEPEAGAALPLGGDTEVGDEARRTGFMRNRVHPGSPNFSAPNDRLL